MNPKELNTKEWSISTKNFGELVTDEQDINQCINIIFSTQKGSDPLRPNFGTDIQSFVDLPINQLIPLVKKELIEQVSRWEKRASIKSILHEINDNQVIFSVNWIDIRNKNSSSTNLSIQLQ